MFDSQANHGDTHFLPCHHTHRNQHLYFDSSADVRMIAFSSTPCVVDSVLRANSSIDRRALEVTQNTILFPSMATVKVVQLDVLLTSTQTTLAVYDALSSQHGDGRSVCWTTRTVYAPLSSCRYRLKKRVV